MKPLLLCLGLLTLLPPLAAQPQAPIRIRLQALTLGDSEIEGLLYHDGREMQPLHAPISHFHFPVEYEGPNPITLFVRRENPAEGETPYQPVTQIALPESAGAAVLLLSRQGGQLRGNVVPLREEGFPLGSLMMLNVSGREVHLRLGEELHRLAAGRTQFIRPASRERGVLPMIYRFADDPENESLVSSGWFYHPERRYFVLVLDNQGQVGMRSITWFPPQD